MSKKQDSQLKKLNLIEEKLNKFCEQFDLNLNLNEKTKSTSEKTVVDKPRIKWDEKVFENLKRPLSKQNVSKIKQQIFSSKS